MDTRQAEYVVAVADELSFTRAARRVHAVQSTVSAGVRALETELGARLFERDQGGVRLTSAGEAVLPALRELLSAGARARTAADPQGELRGELHVGVFSSVSHLAVPRAIGAFREAHPQVDLRLRAAPGGSGELAHAVSRGRLDVSLFGLPVPAAPGLRAHRLASSPYCVLLPPGHRLSGRAEIRLAELRDEAFVDSPAGFGNRAVLDGVLQGRGIVRSVPVEVGETAAISAFVRAGLGVGLLPEILVPPHEQVEMVPLVERIEWDFTVITGTSPSQAASAFVSHLLDVYQPARTEGG